MVAAVDVDWVLIDDALGLSKRVIFLFRDHLDYFFLILTILLLLNCHYVLLLVKLLLSSWLLHSSSTNCYSLRLGEAIRCR